VTSERETAYLKALGSRLLSEANDLKRTPEALASDLGIELASLREVIEGHAKLDDALAIIFAMVKHYPISLDSLWLNEDDTTSGISIVSAAQSRESSRIFQRPTRDGTLAPYYEYRDTAMSRGAPFRPEWIKELRCVDDSDPENPDVVYNNGHFLHQVTFFIGAVNFYWEHGGRMHCAEMNTGDSNYITPFVRHSFASRDPDHPGIIIAITYWGLLYSARDSISRVDMAGLEALSGDSRVSGGFAGRLKRHLDAESLSVNDLLVRLGNTDQEQMHAVCTGQQEPSHDQIEMVANALNIRPTDLMGAIKGENDDVFVRRRADAPVRAYPASNNDPAYQLIELVRDQNQPYLKAFDVSVVGDQDGEFHHGLHQYVFNYGEEAVDLFWGNDESARLEPGDSAYVRPLTKHRFARVSQRGAGQLVVMRVPGMLTDSVLDEYAGFAPGARQRVAAETRQWF